MKRYSVTRILKKLTKEFMQTKVQGGVDGVTTKELEEYMRANWRSAELGKLTR